MQRALNPSRKPPQETQGLAWAGDQVFLPKLSNFPDLDSELLGDEPQTEAGMSTLDEARTGFREVTHLLGLAQGTTSRSGVQGLVLRSSCPWLDATRVCAGDR